MVLAGNILNVGISRKKKTRRSDERRASHGLGEGLKEFCVALLGTFYALHKINIRAKIEGHAFEGVESISYNGT